jgi:hypothetical protein
MRARAASGLTRSEKPDAAWLQRTGSQPSSVQIFEMAGVRLEKFE